MTIHIPAVSALQKNVLFEFIEHIEVKVGLLFENVLTGCKHLNPSRAFMWRASRNRKYIFSDNLIFRSSYNSKESNLKSLVGWIRSRHVHKVTV